MLKIWKITVPADTYKTSELHGWALAETAEEAMELSGSDKAVIRRMPDRLWIVPERVVWERREAA